ncbi:MAG: hypothetical protein Q8Q06_04375 [bacterium]|nr:hypothetical protein [bacterium]
MSKILVIIATILVCVVSAFALIRIGFNLNPKEEKPVEVVWGPGAENSIGPHINNSGNTMHFIIELVAREAKGTLISFPLEHPFRINNFSAMLSYTALGSPCGDAAVVGFLGSDEDNIMPFDMRINTEYPVPIIFHQNFGNGIVVENLYLSLFDDMCHPTNLRITFQASGEALYDSPRKYLRAKTEHGKRFNIQYLY